MKDKDLVAAAGRQHNRISRAQILALGGTPAFIEHRVATGRLTICEAGVYAVSPVLDDRWGRWMGATLTHPGAVLSHLSAACAYGMLERDPAVISITRPGSAGPRRHGGTWVFRRPDLAGETGTLRGIPITSPDRTLLDIAKFVTRAQLARAVRQAVRVGHTSIERIMQFAFEHPRRHGVRKLMRCVARYAGLPLQRARSGAEVKALLILRAAGYVVPKLNHKVADVEADLVWRDLRLIVEVDGGPFHLDAGEDARKEAIWRDAGFDVRRIDSDDLVKGLLPLVPEAASVPFTRAGGDGRDGTGRGAVSVARLEGARERAAS